MSSDRKFLAENFSPFDRAAPNNGPIPGKGKADPAKKPPFKIGKPVGDRPATKNTGKGKKR